MKKILFAAVLSVTLLSTVASEKSWAFGPPRPSQPQNVPDLQAFPVRYVTLGQFSTTPFTLPNGTNVGQGLDVARIVDTQINRSAKFRTLVQAPQTGRYGVLSGAITALEMDIVNTNIHFGYRPGGQDVGGGNLNVNGKVEVHVGTVTMDFRIHDSVTNEVYGAVTVDQATAGLQLNFEIDFGDPNVGFDFFWRTKMKDVVQGLATNALRQLVSAPRVNLLPWVARVRDVDLAQKLVIFDAGVQAGVGANEIYGVYSQCQGEGCIERYVADVKVKRAYVGDAAGSTPQGYSEAAVKQDSNDALLHRVRAGDKVLIQYLHGF